MGALFVTVGAVLITALVSHAFHSYLKLRERERLSATDKAALEKRFEDYDNKFRALKDTVTNIRSR